MKVLITGGSGFTGSHLAQRLRMEGRDVFTLSIEPRVGDNRHILADVTNRETMFDLIPRFDVVYHLAGLLGTHELISSAFEASRVNILGTVNILDGALRKGTKVVYISKPNLSLNTYSITKYAGESFVRMYHDELQLPTVCIKWFNIYGPGQSFHPQKAVPYFIRWAIRREPIEIWGTGEQTMDLMHVADAVSAAVLIADEPKLEGTTVDVGSGKETTVNDLAKLIVGISHSRTELRYLPMRSGEPLNIRLKADATVLTSLGYVPRIDLKAGLRETFEWYRKHLAPSSS